MDTVSELMTPWPQVVPADARLSAAARILIRLGIRHLPVVGRDGAIAGVLTDFAVFAHGGLVGAREELWIAYDDEGLTAADVMVPAEVVAREDDALLPILRRLVRSAQDIVVVVDAHRHPVGVLTEHDGVRLACGVLRPERTIRKEGSGEVRSVRRDAPAMQGLQIMRAHRIRHLIVEEADGALFGVVSYGDLIADAVHDTPDRTFDDVVRSVLPITVRNDAPAIEAARLMVRHKVGCVPVLNKAGRCFQVITRTDILEALVADLDDEELFDAAE